ncbi:MAG TPA: dihydrodipicolinate reductase, partial [Acidimicrobiia bacterium]
MNEASSARLRVVQCGTGNIGRRALREVIRHPDLELVGVQVYGSAKDGVDAGVLCGEPPVGVVATTDPVAIRSLKADCALYMPMLMDLDHVVELLETGTNVVTTRGELFAGGRRLGEEERARVVEACAHGESSIYATGSSPGFITDALPFALLSLQRRVELVEIEEFANLSRRDSPDLLFELMGFGRPPASFDSRRSSYLLGEF